MRKTIQNVLDVLDTIEDWFLVALLAVMVILAVVQILYRNVFDIGLLWADPLLRTLVLWVALAGAVIAARTDDHIRIDFFMRYMPARWLVYVRRLVYLFSAAVCLLISWHAYRFVASEYEIGTTVFLDIPSWITASVIPLGFFMIAFRYLLLFISPQLAEAESLIIPESES